jgi:hypothetical protein
MMSNLMFGVMGLLQGLGYKHNRTMANRFQGKDALPPGKGQPFYGTSGKVCQIKLPVGTIVLFGHTGLK